MERDLDARNFFFCIPLVPKANATDWTQVCTLLDQTLRSIANQTNKSFRVVLAAQDKPDLAPDLGFDVVHVVPRWKVEGDIKSKWRDKRWKRTLLLRTVRELGGGYVMMLDADDLVSNRLVDYVLTDRDPNGYIIETGYAYDWKANLIAPIPGVWENGFDSVCGSCSVIKFALEDLPPLRRDNKANYLAKRLKQHSQWKNVMRDAGRPLKVLPFPGVVYTLNHNNNLHYLVSPNRQATVPTKIKSLHIPLSIEMIKEFSLPASEPLLVTARALSPEYPPNRMLTEAVSLEGPRAGEEIGHAASSPREFPLDFDRVFHSTLIVHKGMASPARPSFWRSLDEWRRRGTCLAKICQSAAGVDAVVGQASSEGLLSGYGIAYGGSCWQVQVLRASCSRSLLLSVVIRS